MPMSWVVSLNRAALGGLIVQTLRRGRSFRRIMRLVRGRAQRRSRDSARVGIAEPIVLDCAALDEFRDFRRNQPVAAVRAALARRPNMAPRNGRERRVVRWKSAWSRPFFLGGLGRNGAKGPTWRSKGHCVKLDDRSAAMRTKVLKRHKLTRMDRIAVFDEPRAVIRACLPMRGERSRIKVAVIRSNDLCRAVLCCQRGLQQPPAPETRRHRRSAKRDNRPDHPNGGPSSTIGQAPGANPANAQDQAGRANLRT